MCVRMCVCVRACVSLIRKNSTFLFIQTAVPSDFNPLNSCSNSFSRPGERDTGRAGEERLGGCCTNVP